MCDIIFDIHDSGYIHMHIVKQTYTEGCGFNNTANVYIIFVLIWISSYECPFAC